MKTGKSLTFRSILISYLVLCLAMLTVTIIGYSSSIFYVQKEIRNSAALRMREVMGKIENNIRLSYQLCDTLAVSGGLDDIASIEGNFSPQQILDSMKLKNTMSELNVQNNQLFLPTVWYHCTGFLLLDDRRKSKILSGFIR